LEGLGIWNSGFTQGTTELVSSTKTFAITVAIRKYITTTISPISCICGLPLMSLSIKASNKFRNHCPPWEFEYTQNKVTASLWTESSWELIKCCTNTISYPFINLSMGQSNQVKDFIMKGPKIYEQPRSHF